MLLVQDAFATFASGSSTTVDGGFMVQSASGGTGVGFGFDADDLKDATKYEKYKNGKREFKGKSPLATSKGGTLVAREGLMDSLKKKFGKDLKDKSILNEETILDE